MTFGICDKKQKKKQAVRLYSKHGIVCGIRDCLFYFQVFVEDYASTLKRNTFQEMGFTLPITLPSAKVVSVFFTD